MKKKVLIITLIIAVCILAFMACGGTGGGPPGGDPPDEGPKITLTLNPIGDPAWRYYGYFTYRGVRYYEPVTVQVIAGDYLFFTATLPDGYYGHIITAPASGWGYVPGTNGLTVRSNFILDRDMEISWNSVVSSCNW